MAGSRLAWFAVTWFAVTWIATMALNPVACAQDSTSRRYLNRLTPIENPLPLLADYPTFVEPVREVRRFEAPALVEDDDPTISVRAWRYSYNARGIIELPNRLRGRETAIIVVHPWGIDDSNGWASPEPAGVALCCTPEKNVIYNRHIAEVVNPFLKRWRSEVGIVGYSLPGKEDAIRKKLFRSVRSRPTPAEQREGARMLSETLAAFEYKANPVDAELSLSGEPATAAYFKAFPGLDSGPKFNGAGFWELPIPLDSHIDRAADDVVFYDAEGYEILRDFLRAQGIRHVLLTGYNTDMCVCKTTAGYENLMHDFNVFLVGDATIATFPANDSPRYATNAAVSFAALRLLITQVSWVIPTAPPAVGK